MSETVKFVQMMDRFFDCLNVNSFNKGKRRRKEFQDPYRSGSDFRLKVCFLFLSNFASVQYAVIHCAAIQFPCSGWRKSFWGIFEYGKIQ